MFRTIGDRPSSWESSLPPELLRLPEELARVDAPLDDAAFFAPFAPYLHPVLGRPSTPVECYLRLMFLKFRYRLGYESLCAEVSDSISWRRFCRIGLDGRVPHPTTLMKLTTRCWEAAVGGLNEALLAKAAGARLLRTARMRADATVIGANVAYSTDSGLLARAVGKIVRTARLMQAAGGAASTAMAHRRRATAAPRMREVAARLRSRGKLSRDETTRVIRRVIGERADLAEKAAAQAAAVLRNSRRAHQAGAAGYGGRCTSWRVTIERTATVVAQARTRLAGRCRTAQSGWSARTIPTPGRSARDVSTAPSSSGTRPRSPTMTTASSWTTPSNTAPPQTACSRCPPSNGSPGAPARCPARSPPTAATPGPRSSVTCMTWGSGPWLSPPGHHLTSLEDHRAQPQLPPAGQAADRMRGPDQPGGGGARPTSAGWRRAGADGRAARRSRGR